MHASQSFFSVPAVLGTVLLALASCKSTPPASPAPTSSSAAPTSAKIEQEVNARSEVVAIDSAARLVTLRNEDGRLMQIRAGEAVRNFDQIAVGDTLQVRYKIGLTATRLHESETMREARGAAYAQRAPKGATPSAGVGVSVSVRVKIESIDAARDIVVFSRSDGELITHRIASDTGREFVRKLKIGDLVQLDYEEVFALGIEKVAS